MRESRCFCDLCGKEILEDEDSEMWRNNQYTVDIGQLDGGSDYELRKDICEDCAKKIYKGLADFAWEH